MKDRKIPEKRAMAEVLAVVAAGTLHVTTELATNVAVSRVYNATACVLFLGYVVWRVRSDPTVLRAWGFRADNLRRASLAYALLVLVAWPALYGAGVLLDVEPGLRLSSLALYLVWGLAQQFALQNLLAANLAALISRGWLSAALASLLFAASHVPRLELAGVACVGGFAFVLLYRRFPNLYAVGIAHGVLGWLSFGLLGLE